VARLNEHPPARTLGWVGYTNLRTYMEAESELAYIRLDVNNSVHMVQLVSSGHTGVHTTDESSHTQRSVGN